MAQVSVVLFLTDLLLYLLIDFFSLFFFNQATAEQIRLAQMIYDTNDADFEIKIKQVTRF